jgi:hypothetical protein
MVFYKVFLLLLYTVEIRKRLHGFEEISKRLRDFNEIKN